MATVCYDAFSGVMTCCDVVRCYVVMLVQRDSVFGRYILFCCCCRWRVLWLAVAVGYLTVGCCCPRCRCCCSCWCRRCAGFVDAFTLDATFLLRATPGACDDVFLSLSLLLVLALALAMALRRRRRRVVLIAFVVTILFIAVVVVLLLLLLLLLL